MAAVYEQNGRVQLTPGENGAAFHLFGGGERSMRDGGCDLIRDREANATSLLFMSADNVEALQQALRYQVYVRSLGVHVIDRQSEPELMTVMRSVYLQNGMNTTAPDGGPDLREVVRLNAIVIDYCVPEILSSLEMYLRYRRDVSELPVPMSHGAFVSSKGERSLGSRPPF